jgi:hypothetical protein
MADVNKLLTSRRGRHGMSAKLDEPTEHLLASGGVPLRLPLGRETPQLVASVVEEPEVDVALDELAPNVTTLRKHLQNLPTNGCHAQTRGGIRAPRLPMLDVLAVAKVLLGGAFNVSLLR